MPSKRNLSNRLTHTRISVDHCDSDERTTGMREACQKSMFERFFPSLHSTRLSALSPVGYLTRALPAAVRPRHTERLSIQIEERRRSQGGDGQREGWHSFFLS